MKTIEQVKYDLEKLINADDNIRQSKLEYARLIKELEAEYYGCGLGGYIDPEESFYNNLASMKRLIGDIYLGEK